jgi:nitrite reductase (NADH) small subunit
MGEFTTVCRVDQIPLGEAKCVEVKGKLVAIFHRHDGFHAIDDVCPHMGASLSEGLVEGDIVTCPWHEWRFRITDGVWADNPRIKTGSYPVRVEDGQVQVQVDAVPPAKS